MYRWASTVAVSPIADVAAAAAQIATTIPVTGMVLASGRSVSSGRLARN
ncbi:MAG: hypothetical protein ACRDN0_21750 [Trebonia sp.]